jgi:cell wall assembly regulator SMI1
VFTLGEALAERRWLLDFALQTSADIRRDEPDAGPEDPFTRADHWWRPPWLPIARGGGSEELAIDLSADRSPGLRY